MNQNGPFFQLLEKKLKTLKVQVVLPVLTSSGGEGPANDANVGRTPPAGCPLCDCGVELHTHQGWLVPRAYTERDGRPWTSVYIVRRNYLGEGDLTLSQTRHLTREKALRA